MRCPENSDAPASRNPDMAMIEPATVEVQPDHQADGVLIRISDNDGKGFGAVIPQDDALDMVLLVLGSLARLRGYGGPA